MAWIRADARGYDACVRHELAAGGLIRQWGVVRHLAALGGLA
jgi:hypothetical protein